MFDQSPQIKPASKIILTDIDGTVVKWLQSFETFVKPLGYNIVNRDTFSLTEMFGGIYKGEMDGLISAHNLSPRIMNLQPAFDAVKYIKLLRELGFTFIGITSLSKHEIAKHYRAINLIKLFGEGTFTDIYTLDHDESKSKVLSKWKNSGLFWVEDNLPNALLGQELGLRSRLITRPYNASDDVITRIDPHNPWEQIYNEISLVYGLTHLLKD